MAIYKKGADPVALRASAERMTAYAHECDGARGEASKAVGALGGNWSGGDLDHLMSQWPPIEAQLGQFSSHLGRLAQVLQRNAAQQEAASGSGPGPAGPTVTPGPVGPSSPGPGGNGGGQGDETGGGSVLDGLGLSVAVVGAPALVGQTAGVLSTLSKTDGLLLSSRYLANITEMAKVGDPLFDLLPTASKVGGISNLAADAWSMKGLSGLFAEGSKVGSAVGKYGVLGPIGIGLSAAALGTSIVQGDTRGIIENGLGTGLAVGAVFAPPPINLACGIAGLGLAAYQNIPAVHEAVDAVLGGIGDVASDIGDAASDFWHSIF